MQLNIAILIYFAYKKYHKNVYIIIKKLKQYQNLNNKNCDNSRSINGFPNGSNLLFSIL